MSKIEELRKKLLEKKSVASDAVGKDVIVTADTPVKVGTELPEASQVIDRINNLQHHMENSIPGYESILHKIHQQLLKDVELTHVLTEEQIGIILRGLKKKKEVIITKEAAKKLGKKSLKKTEVDDLI